jgi:hypothetical protein
MVTSGTYNWTTYIVSQITHCFSSNKYAIMISHVHDFSFPTNVSSINLTTFAEGDFHTFSCAHCHCHCHWLRNVTASWYIDVTTSSISSQNFKLRLFQRFHILVHHILHFTWNILFVLVNNRPTTPLADKIYGSINTKSHVHMRNIRRSDL